MEAMRRNGITQILTHDGNFTREGYTILLLRPGEKGARVAEELIETTDRPPTFFPPINYQFINGYHRNKLSVLRHPG